MSSSKNKKEQEEQQQHEYYEGASSLSPIPLSVSSAPIKAVDKGKVKAVAVESMYNQAEQQMSMLRRQAQLLMDQAKEIEKRLEISKKIYEADMGFKPLPGHTYHLYKKNEKLFLSLIAPYEWGNKITGNEFLATVRLLSDHTWEIIDQNKKGSF